MRALFLALVVAAMAVVLAAPAHAELSPDELLAQYQPVTVLDVFEQFAPSSVEGFLADADLELRGSDGSYEPVAVPPAGLPTSGDGWRLNHRGCSPANGLPAVACYAAAGGGPRIVYGRHEVRAGVIVLQYWYFYDDNFWSLQYPPTGLVWQAHEGDWEVVTVVLDEEQQPVAAAYSQHCGGERRPWAAVPKFAGTSHPLVFVASGSHANLFAPGIHAIPLACYPAQAVAFFRAFGVTPFDFAIPGTLLGPGTTAIDRLHDNSPRWLRFPGAWGEAQYVHAPDPIGTVPFGTSPVGPALHEVWVDPLGTIAGYAVG